MLAQLTSNLSLSVGALIAVALYLFCTRAIGRPTLVESRQFTVWVIDILVWPIGIVALFIVVREIIHWANMVEMIPQSSFLQSFVMYVVVFWLLARGFDMIFLRWFVYHRTGFSTPGLLRGLTYGVFMVAALGLFLWRIDYPITGFLVSTGVVAGILGFALQSTLSDFFSGIALSLEKPFHIGEWVEFEDKSVGQVVDMTWRSTRLKTFSNTLLSIPNSKMAALSINNLDRPDGVYAVWYTIRVNTEAEPKLVVTLLSAAVGRCRHVLARPVPIVRLQDASGAPYLYMVWVHYRSFLAHFRAQEQLYMEIHAALTSAGITPVGELQEVRYARAKALNPTNPRMADTLRSLEIFSALQDDEIEQIASASEYVLVEADTVLVHENTDAKHVYIVVNGSLETSIGLSDGTRALADQLNAGDSFGWAAIVADEGAIMTVRAVSDALVLIIDGDCLQPILKAHDDLRQRFSDLVTARIQRLNTIRTTARSGRRALSANEIRRRIEKFVSGGQNFDSL